MTALPERIHDFITEEQAPYAVHRHHLPSEALDLLREAADTISSLSRWKAEASTVLGQWDDLFEALGRPGRLGVSKASAVTAEVRHLQAKLDAIATYFADDRSGYYGYDETGYERWMTYENIRDDISGILR